jgi:SHS family sialic acid transporter-like MFS transporter
MRSGGAIFGGLAGGWAATMLGRRTIYFLISLTSFCLSEFIYLALTPQHDWFWGFVFALGVVSTLFFGWLPLYLPELFRTNVRATGQGFGFNFGRILAAIGVLQTGNLMGLFKTDIVIGGLTIPQGYPLACSTMSLVYLIGIAIIWLAPETRGKPLPD